MATQQYAYRSLKQLGLVAGSPLWEAVDAFERCALVPEQAELDRPGANIRAYAYSGDGRLFAFASAQSVRVVDAVSGQLVCDIPAKAVVEIGFSPKGTQLSTWERMVKPEDGSQHLNMRIWDVATVAQVAGFSVKGQDGWRLQYSEDEAYALRQVTNEVHVYRPAEFDQGVQQRLQVENITSFSLSPGRNPSVAVFVAEKKGAAASVKIYQLAALSSVSAQKSFYKADKIQMKWNAAGTSLLFLTQTDVDKTGKSYYGETNMYLLASTGIFDCRVTLDKEGPIHDFEWSPNEREFAVVYGFMPAKTVLFDHRVNVVAQLGSDSRNLVSFNPQGRLLATAGFGNLQGSVDVWDRKTLKKIATFDAPNTSHLEWSPDGRSILCATLSPRLRVDNGVRIYHHSGTLLHVELIEELYAATWRPQPAAQFPFRDALSPAPAPSAAALSSAPVKAAPKAAGAYRPPGARGTATSLAYRREEDGGLPSSNGINGSVGPARSAQSRRVVPGAAVPTEEPANGKGKQKSSAQAAAAPTANGAEPPNPVEKKRRALNKKLDAIQQLKDRRDRGDQLEQTQLSKIESEASVRKELDALR